MAKQTPRFPRLITMMILKNSYYSFCSKKTQKKKNYKLKKKKILKKKKKKKKKKNKIKKIKIN